MEDDQQDEFEGPKKRSGKPSESPSAAKVDEDMKPPE